MDDNINYQQRQEARAAARAGEPIQLASADLSARSPVDTVMDAVAEHMAQTEPSAGFDSKSPVDAVMDAVAEHKAQADARFYSQTPVEAVESALRERSQGQDITKTPIKCGIALSDSFNLNAANTQPAQAPAISNEVHAPAMRQPVHAAPGM